jgi:hypothetical protein
MVLILISSLLLEQPCGYSLPLGTIYSFPFISSFCYFSSHLSISRHNNMAMENGFLQNIFKRSRNIPSPTNLPIKIAHERSKGNLIKFLKE